MLNITEEAAPAVCVRSAARRAGSAGARGAHAAVAFGALRTGLCTRHAHLTAAYAAGWTAGEIGPAGLTHCTNLTLGDVILIHLAGALAGERVCPAVCSAEADALVRGAPYEPKRGYAGHAAVARALEAGHGVPVPEALHRAFVTPDCHGRAVDVLEAVRAAPQRLLPSVVRAHSAAPGVVVAVLGDIALPGNVRVRLAFISPHAAAQLFAAVKVAVASLAYPRAGSINPADVCGHFNAHADICSNMVL